MAYSTCEDCGNKLYGGVCSNCQEELYIVQEQAEFIEAPLSSSFLEKVAEQEELLEVRKER